TDLGARTSPACANLNSDTLPDLLVGSSRGGIHYLSSTNDSSRLPNFMGKIYLPKLGVSLYPNPAYDKLYVTADRYTNHLNLDVYDMTGRKISTKHIDNYRSESVEIPTGELAGGAYFIKVNAEGYT